MIYKVELNNLLFALEEKDDLIIQAPLQQRWCMGKTREFVFQQLERKGAKIEEIPNEDLSFLMKKEKAN